MHCPWSLRARCEGCGASGGRKGASASELRTQLSIRFHDERVQLLAGLVAEMARDPLAGPGGAVGAVVGERGGDVCHVDDAEGKGERAGGDAVGITGAVEPLVVPADELEDLRGQRGAADQ